MDYSKIITIEPGKRSGKSCTRGMKMLFDQNLSFKLVSAVTSAFPGSKHVRGLGIQTTAVGGIGLVLPKSPTEGGPNDVEMPPV